MEQRVVQKPVDKFRPVFRTSYRQEQVCARLLQSLVIGHALTDLRLAYPFIIVRLVLSSALHIARCGEDLVILDKLLLGDIDVY